MICLNTRDIALRVIFLKLIYEVTKKFLLIDKTCLRLIIILVFNQITGKDLKFDKCR